MISRGNVIQIVLSSVILIVALTNLYWVHQKDSAAKRPGINVTFSTDPLHVTVMNAGERAMRINWIEAFFSGERLTFEDDERTFGLDKSEVDVRRNLIDGAALIPGQEVKVFDAKLKIAEPFKKGNEIATKLRIEACVCVASGDCNDLTATPRLGVMMGPPRPTCSQNPYSESQQ